jgi:hypothetical protein
MPGSSRSMQSRRNASVIRSGRYGSMPRSWSENTHGYGSSVVGQHSVRDSIFPMSSNSLIDSLSKAIPCGWWVFVSLSMILRSVH